FRKSKYSGAVSCVGELLIGEAIRDRIHQNRPRISARTTIARIFIDVCPPNGLRLSGRVFQRSAPTACYASCDELPPTWHRDCRSLTVRTTRTVDPVESLRHSILSEYDRQCQRRAKQRYDEPRAEAVLRRAVPNPYEQEIREGRDR